MGQIQVFNRTFLRGLETTRDESGAPDWSGFRRFKNTRVGKDEGERRGGMSLVATMPDTGSAVEYLGSPGIAVCREEVWALDRPKWALDLLLQPGTVALAETVLDTGSIVISKTAGGLWEFAVGTVTLQAAAHAYAEHFAMVRDETHYRLLAEGVEVDSGLYTAPAAHTATLELGDFVGVLDFLRLRAPGPTVWGARHLRLLNPRGRGVLACYRDAQDDNDILYDHSIYEAHVKGGSMNPPHARLSNIRHVPIQGMQTYVDESDRRRLFVVAGGEEYDAAYE